VPAVEARNLGKTYRDGALPVEALRDVSLRLDPGDFVAVMGPSGCGKSTLLHICGAMDRPTQGRVVLGEIDITRLAEDQLTRLRREKIGFVFQFFNLLPTLNVSENIALPLLLAGRPAGEAEFEAVRLAGRVGISHRLRHHPSQLSGGELQRAAIARAVIHRPSLLIADEPTGNLDSENGLSVLRLIQELNSEIGVAVLMATHAPEVAAAATRVLRMRDGSIDGGKIRPDTPKAEEAGRVAPI
jgi:putative ABC transport system ATP-binding protein